MKNDTYHVSSTMQGLFLDTDLPDGAYSLKGEKNGEESL